MDSIDSLKQIQDKTKELLPELHNPSVTAEYKLWQQIFAHVSDKLLQQVEQDKAEIQAIIERNRGICTPDYFIRIAKEFQWDSQIAYKLEVNASGQVQYPVIRPEHRIIKQAAVSVGTGKFAGTVTLKVATSKGDALGKITPKQLTDLKNYISVLCIPGMPIQVISEMADTLNGACTVYYDPLLNHNLLERDILQALVAYSQSSTFNGFVSKNKLIDHIQAVDGVLDVDVTALTLSNASNQTTTILNRQEPLSGYFNIGTFTITPATFTPNAQTITENNND